MHFLKCLKEISDDEHDTKEIVFYDLCLSHTYFLYTGIIAIHVLV